MGNAIVELEKHQQLILQNFVAVVQDEKIV
jgi:hypothetical protein